MRAAFRAVLQRPALILAEIAWRWAFGAAAWVLVILVVRRILAQVDITQAEVLIARRSDLFLIADACARIVIQVVPQLARECLVLVPAIAVLWTAAATVGRAVTLGALLPQAESAKWVSLLALNLLRALLTLAAVVACLGALFLAGMAMPAQDLTTAAAVGILLALLVAFFWSVVNWFLALAPIWVVRDGHSAMKSIGDSLELFRRNSGRYAGTASGFGGMRAVALVAAILGGVVVSQSAPAVSVALCVVIALVYFALADFLYIARLAAYVALDEGTQPSAISVQPSAPEPLIPAAMPPTNSNS